VLEHCIQLLTASPHAPIREEAPKLLSGITDYLSSLNNVKSAPHAAFSALNEVLSRTITDNIELAQNTMLSVIPIIRKFWSSKSAALREEMLITLVVGKDVLVSLSRSPPPEPLIETLQPLVEQLQSTYLKLPEKEALQVDDTLLGTSSSYFPMGNQSLSPRPGDRRSVANWTTLWAIAYLVQILDRISQSVNGPTDEAPKKRPRLESRTEDIFRDAASAFGTSRVFALQLLPFMLSDLDPGADQLSSLLRGLAPNILDENPLVASWTMIAISR
jgi:ataxia telangiectasia mutated family protein